MALLVFSVLSFLAFTGRSSDIYCLCKDGLSDADLQKVIDNACGDGADCDAIQSPNGACFQPDTLKDHCNYAANSFYYDGGTCDFDGAATTSSTPPNTLDGCVYPAVPSGFRTPPPASTDTPPDTAPPSTDTPPDTSPPTPKPPSTGTTPCPATGRTPVTNGSTGISYSGAVVALLLVLTPVWLALRA